MRQSNQQSDIRETALAGVSWTTLKNVGILLLGLINLLILVRFISKDAFGIYALANIVFTFSIYLSDFGLSESIIHYQKTTRRQLSALYWINVAIGASLFGLVYLIREPVSAFYEAPLLVPILIWVGLNLFIYSIGQQFKVLLHKHMRFASLAKIQMLGMVCYTLTSIGLAINGFDIYALVYAEVVKTVVLTIAYVRTGWRIHRPGLNADFTSIDAHLRYGVFQVGRTFTEYAYNQLDHLLIGKFMGSTALGSYDVMKRITTKPGGLTGPIISEVSFPVLARMQDDKPGMGRFYFGGLNRMHTVSFFLFALIVAFSQYLVPVFLGEGWDEIIEPLRWLAVYFMFKNQELPTGSLLMATGRVHWAFYWNLALLIVFFTGLYFAVQSDLQTVVKLLVPLQILATLGFLIFVIKKIIPVSYRQVMDVYGVPIILAFASTLPALLLATMITMSDWMMLMACLVLSTAIYAGFVFWFRPAIANDILNVFRKFLDRRPTA